MLESKSLTIMFTDMKDFTQYITHVSRVEGIEFIKKHENLLLPVLEAYGGRIIKNIGDSFLVTFESPTNAVLAGMALQQQLRDRNVKEIRDPQRRIEVRVAIHTGEVTLTENDVYGDAVNVASRILGIAEPNEVYFTEATYLLMNKREVPSSEIGDRFLKGIPEKVKIYKVLDEKVLNEPASGVTHPSPHGAPPSTFTPSPPPAASTPVPSPLAYTPAGFGWRLLAFFIDAIILGLVAGLLRSHEGGFVLGTLYILLFWTLRSATPGKMALGLKIFTKQGTPLNFKTALIRYLGTWVSALGAGLGFLWIAWHPRKQGWHDLIARTYVVKIQ